MHRVQRVPATEAQGRIHTSTATVAVLPEAEDVEIEIEADELRIDVYRSSRPRRPVGQHDRLGGAHHAPADRASWSVAEPEVAAPEPREGDARAARAPLRARSCEQQQAELGAERRSQIGTGDRSEKIRTYNFPQDRVTDHRIGLTVHNLDEVLNGELSEFTGALAAEEKRARLEAQTA